MLELLALLALAALVALLAWRGLLVGKDLQAQLDLLDKLVRSVESEQQVQRELLARPARQDP